jgi:ABC-type molybdate transport system substrate-binding protein
MQLYNNTPNQLFYSIGDASSADCGTIDAGQTAALPYYDNQQNVSVAFQVNGSSPNPIPYSVTIPSSGTGMSVTLGFYTE